MYRRGLTDECKEWCNKLNVRCVTMGTEPIPAKARSDDFKIKQALWAENDKEIRMELDKKEKEISRCHQKKSKETT